MRYHLSEVVHIILTSAYNVIYIYLYESIKVMYIHYSDA